MIFKRDLKLFSFPFLELDQVSAVLKLILQVDAFLHGVLEMTVDFVSLIFGIFQVLILLLLVPKAQLLPECFLHSRLQLGYIAWLKNFILLSLSSVWTIRMRSF